VYCYRKAKYGTFDEAEGSLVTVYNSSWEEQVIQNCVQGKSNSSREEQVIQNCVQGKSRKVWCGED
jgi:hypothetical protein